MVENVKPYLLNLGAGYNRLDGFVSVDAWGDPDIKWDLNQTPYPWADNSVDGIEMWHTLEHLTNWWESVKECARILKPGGYLNIRVPDESSATALTYRDHVAVFSQASFHGVIESTHGTNAWAELETGTVPLRLETYAQVPFKDYEWMARWCPRVLRFCANHMRNFIHEQRFYFRKVGR